MYSKVYKFTNYFNSNYHTTFFFFALMCRECLCCLCIKLLYNWILCNFLEPTRHSHITNFDRAGKPQDIPTLPSRIFRKIKFTQTDGADDHHSNNIEDFFGSIWSLKSKVSNKSPETVRNIIYIIPIIQLLKRQI